MKAGTRVQNAVVDAMPEVKYPDSHYDKACELLRAQGLYEVVGGPEVENGLGQAVQRCYKYGSAWLHEPVPAEVIDELRAI
jgi:hypothetical protein